MKINWFTIIMLFLILLILIGFILGRITNEMCEKKCIEEGASWHQRIPDGKWFSLNDYCICYYDNKMEWFRLG
jgi:hypothetical protein